MPRSSFGVGVLGELDGGIGGAEKHMTAGQHSPILDCVRLPRLCALRVVLRS